MLAVAGCGGSRSTSVSSANPFNWFGRNKDKTDIVEMERAVDPRPVVAEVTRMKVDRLPGGAIVHAFGLPETQGYYEGELVPLNGELPDKGVLTYEFRIIPPATREPAGTTQSREVVIGHYLSDQTLQGVRQIRILAQKNSKSARR